MPKLVTRLPKYRRHTSRNKAFVVVGGKRIYLPGEFGSAESRKEYKRLCLEWDTEGRPATPSPPPYELTITELVAKFWQFAETHYVKNGEPTGTADNYKPALSLLVEVYGDHLATEFGPLALKALRTKMIAAGNSRRYCNDNVSRITKVFRWGASEQLVPSSVWTDLRTVEGLPKGRSPARETAPIKPVSDDVVNLTLAHLPRVVADMVRLQRLTGCRSGEVCDLRPGDVDTSGPIWRYVPREHKTEHHGRPRVILIGRKGQDILRPYLLRLPDAFCFSPRESETRRRRERHEQRTTPANQGDRPGTNRRRNRSRPHGDQYTNDSYRRAIVRACDLAFPPPKGISATEAAVWRKAHRWHPHQLRHTAATEIRQRFGVEAAQVILGHSRADVTQIYAEKNLSLGERVAEAIG